MSTALSERVCALFNGDMPDDKNWLGLLRRKGLDQLPLPGSGHTLERWMALAAVGRFDLSLAKLYEGHTDALAIMAELGASPPEAGLWCVWAAEAPGGRTFIEGESGSVVLRGRKCWCSGAAVADHALLTCWTNEGVGPYLVKVALDQERIHLEPDAWKAVGMASSASFNVVFSGAVGQVLGAPGAYLSRPGFWQGGAGVAACWFGGSLGIAQALRISMLDERACASPFKLAALGKTALALHQTRALLREAAQWIDANPRADASSLALSVRLSAEQCAKRVLDEVGNAMGATPFCLDEKFAKAAADLPVFIRQSHAQRDCAALGEKTLADLAAWEL